MKALLFIVMASAASAQQHVPILEMMRADNQRNEAAMRKARQDAAAHEHRKLAEAFSQMEASLVRFAERYNAMRGQVVLLREARDIRTAMRGLDKVLPGEKRGE